MPMLVFLPWCRLDKNYTVGEVDLIPVEVSDALALFGAGNVAKVHSVLKAFKAPNGAAVEHVTVVRCLGKELLADLAPPEQVTVFEHVQVAAFAGLANRDYFDRCGHYCNSDNFIIHSRYFGKSKSGLARVFYRADGGEEIIFLSKSARKWSISMPESLYPRRNKAVILDDVLLAALSDHFKSLGPREQQRWQDAIENYNRANTDDLKFGFYNQHVVLCSAFQRILATGKTCSLSSPGRTASAFEQAFAPKFPLTMGDLIRRKVKRSVTGKAVRCYWMQKFCETRGRFAHGELSPPGPGAPWSAVEHQILGTIAFPLLVRQLLAEEGNDQLTKRDRIGVEIFERFVDSDMFSPDADGEYPWRRLLGRELDPIDKQRMVKRLHRMRTGEGQKLGEDQN